MPSLCPTLRCVALLAIATSVLACKGEAKTRAKAETEANDMAMIEMKNALAIVFGSASIYFRTKHPMPGADPEGDAPYHCPFPEGSFAGGAAGITPPLSVNCNAGPDGQCLAGGTGPGRYELALWTDNPVWAQMDLWFDSPHSFHLDFIATNEPEGYGHCRFTVQAFLDLDDDGIFSTYERVGEANQDGVEQVVDLRVTREGE